MKISVIAHPNSKNPRIEEDLLQTIHVFVKEPPLENQANIAIINALASYYKVKKSQVRIINGLKSKNKIVELAI
ncbi:MAG TPA: DUF167 domain-containing protein [Candidatus Saccharimonadales bacterium]|nr:DUF167 domain-containing protein [Candidatus Saccharimonadales bacterium]